MKKYKIDNKKNTIMKSISGLLILITMVATSCSKEEVDQTKPEIVMNAESSYPQNCDTLWLGETFTFSAIFTDNQELGSYSIEIHENFDHHSHSTESEACNLMPQKEPVNPFQFLQDYAVPEGMTIHEAVENIYIPDSNNEGPIDDGDYDLSIKLTDREGWATQKVISIKLMRR